MAQTSSARTWLALAAVSLAVFVAALDLTVTAAVLPQLIVDFNVRLIPPPGDLAKAVWIVNGYLVAYVVTMPFMGRVSDLYGRRLVFLICLALFGAGSVWAATTTSLWPMVAARVLQALGGGAMVPVALAAVSDAVTERHRPLALGLVAAVDTAGWVAGPSYGAWMTTSFGSWVAPLGAGLAGLGWRWVFWINLPIALLAALMVAVALPRDRRAARALDLPGALLLTLFLLAFTVALYLGAPASPESGLAMADSAGGSPWIVPLFALALAALAGFIWWERRTSEPMLPLRLLAGRTFAAANLVSLLTGIVLMAVMVEVPVLLQAISPTVEAATAEAGRLLAFFAGGMVGGALVAGPLLRLVAPRWLTVAGLVVMTLGLWQMANWALAQGSGALALPLALAGLGIGLVTTPLAAAVLEGVVEEERGIISSLLLVARLLGMTLGLSVLVTWALNRYEQLLQGQPDLPTLTDPDALAKMVEVGARVTTIIVTDLFLVTAAIGLIALIPALLLQGGRVNRES